MKREIVNIGMTPSLMVSDSYTGVLVGYQSMNQISLLFQTENFHSKYTADIYDQPTSIS